MDKKVQTYLLKLAHNTIARQLGSKVEDFAESGAEILNEKRGVFVTLTIDGRLRGCIGNIMPVYPLKEGVGQNALNAAFDDPRFAPLTESEFKEVEVEISVLSVPEKLEYTDAEDLLKKLEPLKDGVIIKKGGYQATYLPQVWEEIPDKEAFLNSLCMKAGMRADEWRNGEVEVETYRAEVIG